jgi:hypothetical protein
LSGLSVPSRTCAKRSRSRSEDFDRSKPETPVLMVLAIFHPSAVSRHSQFGRISLADELALAESAELVVERPALVRLGLDAEPVRERPVVAR